MLITIFTALVFALSLCADCFAVSVCSSVTLPRIDWKSVLKVGLVFAVIQSGLLFAGYEFGDLFVGYIEKAAKWIGALLLWYVGGSMFKEGLENSCEVRDLNGIRNVIIGGIATSIDALAVGISMSLAQVSTEDIVTKTTAVFLITLLSVIVGMFFGHKIGHRFGKIAEIIGGCVLIGIGIGILL